MDRCGSSPFWRNFITAKYSWRSIIPKDDKVARILEGLPVHRPPLDPRLVSYEWDPTNATKAPFYCTFAPSGRAKCIRCLQVIRQGGSKVMFDTLDEILRVPLLGRNYHLECFALFLIK